MNKSDFIEVSVALLKLPQENELDDRVILQRRSQESKINCGMLGLFGGHVEEGESPLEALRRELKEEIETDLGSLALNYIDTVIVSSDVTGRDDVLFHIHEATLDTSDDESKNENPHAPAIKVIDGTAEVHSLSGLTKLDKPSPALLRLIGIKAFEGPKFVA